MNILEDHGKIPIESIQQDAATAKAGTSDALKHCMQPSKHMYKCLSKSVTTKA
jgi:hypothetical protein